MKLYIILCNDLNLKGLTNYINYQKYMIQNERLMGRSEVKYERLLNEGYKALKLKLRQNCKCFDDSGSCQSCLELYYLEMGEE